MDSAAARGICKREGVGRIRHLSAKILWLQRLIKRGEVELDSVKTADNKADLGTKSFDRKRLAQLRRMVGLIAMGDQEETDELEEENVQQVRVRQQAAAGPGVLRALAAFLLTIHGGGV